MTVTPQIPPVRVLIVDDDRDNRELLALVLGHQGFDITMAGSGEEALALLAQELPDIILLDVMMPRMTGYEVVVAVRDNLATKHLPIIMVSALGSSAAKLAHAAGADDIVSKPVDRDDLCKRMRAVLGTSDVAGSVDASPVPRLRGAILSVPAEARHIVQLYRSDDFLCDTVARFLGTGLARGANTMATATPAHRELILERLEAHGHDTTRSRRAGLLVLHDARDVLSTFMVGDMPDAERFRQHAGALVAEVTATATPVLVFGEMVSLLCQDGNIRAAMRLEQMRHELAKGPVSILCAYALTDFRDAGPSAIADVCRAHAHVLPTDASLPAAA